MLYGCLDKSFKGFCGGYKLRSVCVKVLLVVFNLFMILK